MRYPALLQNGDVIGVCAPSSGVVEAFQPLLFNAIKNVESYGFEIELSPSVCKQKKCVSADAKTRAEEFMALYENPRVRAILPPWGGEFLMDMLPFLDLQKLSEIEPKWVCGYSDISTLLFVLTTQANVATIHGSSLTNMGFQKLHPMDENAILLLQAEALFLQSSSDKYGDFADYGNIASEAYQLDKESQWKSLFGENEVEIRGRMIGGCLDTIAPLIGTRFGELSDFLKAYEKDGFLWTLESCEMNAATIYRTLWQMHEAGWFVGCRGVLFGRPAGYSDNDDFTYIDALENVFFELGVPVLYDADIGHVPPQIQIVNGAYGTVTLKDGAATILQELR